MSVSKDDDEVFIWVPHSPCSSPGLQENKTEAQGPQLSPLRMPLLSFRKQMDALIIP